MSQNTPSSPSFCFRNKLGRTVLNRSQLFVKNETKELKCIQDFKEMIQIERELGVIQLGLKPNSARSHWHKIY